VRTAATFALRIDGRPVAVAPGTTVAAALANAGITHFRTSVGGERRGPLCAMGVCFECRVTIDGVPHRRACMVPCAPDMAIETANAIDLDHDRYSSGGPLQRPEVAVSRSAPGPGASPRQTPHQTEERAGDEPQTPDGGPLHAPERGEATADALERGLPVRPIRVSGQVGETAGDVAQTPAEGLTCERQTRQNGARSAAPRLQAETVSVDVAVVGAGPAGLAAACRAAEAGARVLLVDEAAAPGGQIWRQAAGAAPVRLARRWLARFAASGAMRLGAAAVVDARPGPVLLAERAGGALRIEARSVILATGARERFLPFPGWTLPNVVGVGGAQALLKSGASFRGLRVVVAGSGPLLLPVAGALARAGARLALIAEQAPAGAVMRFAAGLWRRPGRLAQAARYRGAFLRTAYRCGVWVSAARGDGAVREAVLTDGLRSWVEPCDVLACAYGLLPNVELPRLLGCALDDGGQRLAGDYLGGRSGRDGLSERDGLSGRGGRVVRVDGLQRTSVEGVFCAGEPTGIGGLDLALVGGQIAGLAAAGAAPDSPEIRALQRRREGERRLGAALDRAFSLRPELRTLATPETIVCRCEDVPLGRLDPGWAARQAKLYTRAGMGPCQGRICGAALELMLGWDEPDTVRPPLLPVTLANLAELAGAGDPDPGLAHLATDPENPFQGD
jgi:NADPH-dependent 2,4-dienoyl-CoA reductase/sulfur reductase-like enzyme